MELTTARLLLRELREDDAQAINAYERDPEVMRYQSRGVLTLEQSLEHIRKSVALAAEKPRVVFDLAVTLGGEVIGRSGLGIRDAESKRGMLWWIIAPAHQNQGYATEASRALLDLGFGALGLHRIYVDVDPRNLASVKVAQKLGLKAEGQLRENWRVGEEWTDSAIFAALDREWVK